MTSTRALGATRSFIQSKTRPITKYGGILEPVANTIVCPVRSVFPRWSVMPGSIVRE